MIKWCYFFLEKKIWLKFWIFEHLKACLFRLALKPLQCIKNMLRMFFYLLFLMSLNLKYRRADQIKWTQSYNFLKNTTLSNQVYIVPLFIKYTLKKVKTWFNLFNKKIIGKFKIFIFICDWSWFVQMMT